MRSELWDEMHAGLCQELAIIAGQSRRAVRLRPDDATLPIIAEAAVRALDEARWTMDELACDGPPLLLPALRTYARRAEGALGCSVTVTAHDGARDGVRVTRDQLRATRDAVMRLAADGARDIEITAEVDGVHVRAGVRA